MRVLHVVPTFYPAVRYGGTINAVLSLCLNLKALGCEIKVLTTDADGPSRLSEDQKNSPILAPLQVEFCKCVGGEMIAPALIGRLPKLVAWADVVHLTAVYNFPTFPTLFTVRSQQKPMVWSPHGTLQRWSGSRRLPAKAVWEAACRAVMPKNAMLHVTSAEETAESVPKLGNLTASCIPNAVDIPSSAPDFQPDSFLKLLFIGRLEPKKGLENLFNALALLKNNGSTSWRLRIAGRGQDQYEAGLRQMVAESGLASLVEFVGHVDNDEKYQAFAWSDLVVVPSHTENFGIVVAEGLAHARPVIVAQGAPWKEVETHGCGAWVPNAPPSLAQTIQTAAGWDRAAMGLRGREWMLESFSWHARAQEMLSLYERVFAPAA